MDLFGLFKEKGLPLKPKKGEAVFRQGELDAHLYFIETGLLKANYVREDGKELIKSFLKENDIIASLSACAAGEPSTFTLMCLENCSLRKLAFSDVVQVSSSTSDVGRVAMDFLIKLAMKKERREFEFLCLDAEARYEILQRREPDLIKRLTQNDIAKYLGITPVALSRIRSRIR